MFIAETFALFKTFFKFVVRFPKKKYSVNITVKKIIDSAAYEAGIVKFVKIFDDR